MKTFYINLKSATARNQNIQDNIKKYVSKTWQVSRFEAINEQYITDNDIKGSLMPAEKACFLSHKNVIKENLSNDSCLFILEDDAIFGQKSCAIIDQLMQTTQESHWDIIFTDIAVTNISDIAALIKQRTELAANKAILLDLNSTSFYSYGATAYIINSKSKNKIFNLLNNNAELNISYDLRLKQLIKQQQITAHCIFPFVTTISDLAVESQIKQKPISNTGLVWNTFRKMIWLDRDLNKENKDLRYIEEKICDSDAKKFGTLFAAMASEKFKK